MQDFDRDLKEIHGFSQGSKFYRGDKNQGKQSISAEISKLIQLNEAGNVDFVIYDPQLKRPTIFERVKDFLQSILEK